MTITRRTAVGILPGVELERHRSLFDALEAAFAVRFVAPVDDERVAAVVAVGDDARRCLEQSGDRARRLLAFLGGTVAGSQLHEIALCTHPGVDRRLRGTVLDGQVVGHPLALEPGDEPLAIAAGRPIWTCRGGSARIDRVGTPLPALDDGMALIDVLHGRHSLGLVALVQFLRSLEANPWTKPRLRCAFVIDDPNLRRDRYGYVDYGKLVAHADRHGYHVAMAMIPLDARRFSQRAVERFHLRRDRLSLVMHGNDHLGPELANTNELGSALAVVAQASRRIAWFESKTGLTVDRVMMPPHEAWSRASARAIGALGYSGLCAWRPSPTTENGAGRDALAGWTPASFVDGCAVVPRFPWWLPRTAIALRAFLDHPLILYGHHDDLASGLESLASAAARVNSVGEVQWSSVGEIVRNSYDLRVAGDAVAVRPWSRCVRLRVPDPCRELAVVEPLDSSRHGLDGWTVSGDGESIQAFGDRVGVSGPEVSVRLHSKWSTEARDIARGRRSVPALVRRRLTEARDRLAATGRLRGSD